MSRLLDSALDPVRAAEVAANDARERRMAALKAAAGPDRHRAADAVTEAGQAVRAAALALHRGDLHQMAAELLLAREQIDTALLWGQP